MAGYLSIIIWTTLAGIAPTLINATGECSNPAPGTWRMSRGVDITRLDLLPLDTLGSYGFKSPVVNFTCHEGRTWRSPRGGDVYELPDQIWHVDSLPGGWLHAETKIYRNSRDVRDQMNINVGMKVSVKFLFWEIYSFSASSSYKKMQHDIVNSSKTIADVGAFVSATQADFVPSWRLELDMYAKQYVDQMLPASFESNSSAYNDFIKMFGTHYFATAKYGGFIRSFNEISSSYAYSATNTDIESQSKASFFNTLRMHGGFVSESTQVNEQFRQSTTVTKRYYGGYTNLLAEDGIQHWQPTVFSDPWLFSGTLKPISDLIRDPNKKNSMIKAVTTYILKAYLDELDRLLATVTEYDKRSMKNNLISRMSELREKVVLTEAEVTSLDEDIHDLIELRVTPRPTARPTPQPTPRPTQRPITSAPGGGGCGRRRRSLMRGPHDFC